MRLARRQDPWLDANVTDVVEWMKSTFTVHCELAAGHTDPLFRAP